MTNCKDCASAQETHGHWKQCNPLCLFCGVRMIQFISRMQKPLLELAQAKRKWLDHWLTFGHDELEIRRLAKGSMCVAPKGGVR